MATNTKFMFQIDANGKVISGTKLEWSGDPTAVPNYPSYYTTEGTVDVWNNQSLSTYTNGNWTIAAPNTSQQLTDAIKAKIAELKSACRQSILSGFTSSALSVSHTYDFDYEAQTNLNGAYSYANANPAATFDWKTVDVGVITHTAAQTKQLFTDGLAWKESQIYKERTKEKQANACTTMTQLPTITFNNTTPPTVPTGLTGTAGAAGSGQATLNWTANTDVTMLYGGGYNVYKGGVKVNTSLVTTNSYTATGLAAGTYSFTITAVDTDGNESAKSTAVSVTVS